MSDTIEPSDSGTAHSPARRRVRAPVAEEVDVAIIGSGLGGLTAAAYLARQGLRVACFESHYVAGGCATQFRRRGSDGIYHFDIGLHYIGDCRAGGQIPKILDDLDIAIEFVPMDQDGFDTLIFPDFRFRVPANIELYRQRLVEMFPQERRGIDRYVKLLRAVMRMAKEPRGGPPKLRTLLGLGTAAFSLLTNRERTIGEFLDGCTRNPKLRAVLLGQSGDYGLPPSEASAMLHLGLQAHYFEGAFYPKGGGQVIADRLADKIEELGGSVHLRRPVDEILVEGGRAVGLRLAARGANEPGQTVRARTVLSNADLMMTLEKLLPREHLPAEWRTRLSRFHMADAIFITFLGLRGEVAGMHATNYWQFDGYDMEAFYRAGRQPTVDGLIQSSGCYVTSASLKDPQTAQHHAPVGISNVEVMTLVPGSAALWGASAEETRSWQYRRSERYQQIKKSLEDQMIARLEKLFPGSAAAIVYRESATPLSHSRYTRATDGTGYGLAGTPAQFLGHRPGARGPVPGLFLCGASTRAGHGVMGVMMGGRSAARRIAEELGRPLTSRSAAH